MNPTRKRRPLEVVLLVLIAASIGGSLIVWALQKNVTFLHSPSDVLAGKVPDDARFRLGGLVLEDSVARQEGSLEVQFVVTDRFKEFPVMYDGILPDMFREGTSVIATGRIRDGRLVADEVLAKHDEQYMPAEVADAIAAAKAKDAKESAAGDAAAGTSESSRTALPDAVPATSGSY